MATKIDFDITVDAISVVGNANRKITVNLEGVPFDDLCSVISIADAIEYYGEEALLKEIGVDAAIKQFNL